MVYAGYTFHKLDGLCSSQSDISDLRDLSSSDFVPLLLVERGVRKMFHRDKGRGLLLLQGWYMPEVWPLCHLPRSWHQFTLSRHHSVFPGQKKNQGHADQQTLLLSSHLPEHHRIYLIYPCQKGKRGLRTFHPLCNSGLCNKLASGK